MRSINLWDPTFLWTKYKFPLALPPVNHLPGAGLIIFFRWPLGLNIYLNSRNALLKAFNGEPLQFAYSTKINPSHSGLLGFSVAFNPGFYRCRWLKFACSILIDGWMSSNFISLAVFHDRFDDHAFKDWFIHPVFLFSSG